MNPLPPSSAAQPASIHNNLDLLRAIAVLAVFVSHLPVATIAEHPTFFRNLGGGGLLFFVHTSLVLMLSMNRLKHRHVFIAFYVMRIFRIYPLSVACIIAVLITGIDDLRFLSIPVTPVTLLSNLLLAQTLTHAPSIIGPLWSLPWEIQMYLVLPVLFLVTKQPRARPVLLGIWLLFFGGFFAASALELGKLATLAMFPAFFIPGVIAYSLRGDPIRRFPPVCWPIFLVSFCLGRILLLRDANFNLPQNVAVNMLTSLLLGLSLPRFLDVPWRPVAIASNAIAKYSYGIYLFHVPIANLMFRRLSMTPTLPVLLLYSVVVGLASVASFHLLESRATAYGRGLANRYAGANASDRPGRRDGASAVTSPRPQPMSSAGTGHDDPRYDRPTNDTTA